MHPLVQRLEPDGYMVETAEADRFDRYRFVLRRGGERVGRGTHFIGARHIAPWIELQPATIFDPDSDRDTALFAALADALAPGGHIMVHYLQDSTTAAALTADVPPPATPLGYLLWRAGVRWYKDWYFTEGWMEGDQKLQGNLPVDDDHRADREAEMRAALRQFLDDGPDRERCRALAERVLEELR